jgi:hypothetical protein
MTSHAHLGNDATVVGGSWGRELRDEKSVVGLVPFNLRPINLSSL